MATIPLRQGDIMTVAHSKKLILPPPHAFLFSFFRIVGVSFFTTLKYPQHHTYFLDWSPQFHPALKG